VGNLNQRIFLEKLLPQVSGAVLEIGSRDYGDSNPATFRHLYQSSEYTGVDLSPGKGVDMVVDLTEGLGGLREAHYALVICCSVLEHTPKPWAMADNITRLLRVGGMAYISVPWVWRYHAFPDDYFRYSPRGVQVLFPHIEWFRATYSTTVPGEQADINLQNIGDADNQMAEYADTPNGKRKYLPHLMINMLGRRAT